jgi:hypothetical protein
MLLGDAVYAVVETTPLEHLVAANHVVLAVLLAASNRAQRHAQRLPRDQMC